MDEVRLEGLADLLRQRNEIDKKIAGFIGRPASVGHLGEYIASEIFSITLAQSATHRSLDGYFSAGPHIGKSVNIKYYGKREGLIDLSVVEPPDYYLVMTGEASPPVSSRGAHRPFVVEFVYIFDAAVLHASCSARGVKLGIATSVVKADWAAAEVYPGESPSFPLGPEQRRLLGMFSSSAVR
jgi:hypothetical protein